MRLQALEPSLGGTGAVRVVGRRMGPRPGPWAMAAQRPGGAAVHVTGATLVDAGIFLESAVAQRRSA